MTKNEHLAEAIANALIDSGGKFIRTEPCRSCGGDVEFDEQIMTDIILMILENNMFEHWADGG